LKTKERTKRKENQVEEGGRGMKKQTSKQTKKNRRNIERNKKKEIGEIHVGSGEQRKEKR